MWPALVPRCIFQCSFMCCVDCDGWVLEMSLSLFSVHISSVIGYFGDPILQHYFQKKAQSQSVEMRGRLYRKKKNFFFLINFIPYTLLCWILKNPLLYQMSDVRLCILQQTCWLVWNFSKLDYIVCISSNLCSPHWKDIMFHATV